MRANQTDLDPETKKKPPGGAEAPPGDKCVILGYGFELIGVTELHSSNGDVVRASDCSATVCDVHVDGRCAVCDVSTAL